MDINQLLERIEDAKREYDAAMERVKKEVEAAAKELRGQANG